MPPEITENHSGWVKRVQVTVAERGMSRIDMSLDFCENEFNATRLSVAN